MPFWKTKTLSEMSREEWESLCDHCGKCCLLKLQDEEDDTSNHAAHTVYYTNIVCDLFDKQTGHCTDYWNRETRVPSCLRLTRKNLDQINWLPPSCAYRRIMEGQGLPDWHHLVSGDTNTIHESGHSVLGKVIFEKDVAKDSANTDDDQDHDTQSYEEHIVEWPLEN
jgi:uncharacterized cysteine cluster protein YcgN (CxxCxxCC family)